MDSFEEHILQAIRERTKQIVEEETKQAQMVVERRMNALADSIVLSIMKYYDVKRHGENIIITVKKEMEDDE